MKLITELTPQQIFNLMLSTPLTPGSGSQYSQTIADFLSGKIRRLGNYVEYGKTVTTEKQEGRWISLGDGRRIFINEEEVEKQGEGHWITLPGGRHLFIGGGKEGEPGYGKVKPIYAELQGSEKLSKPIRDKYYEKLRELGEDTKGLKIKIEDMQGHVSGLYVSQSKQITIDSRMPSTMINNTLAHEVGHHVWDQQISSLDKSKWVKLSNLKTEKEVSSYAKKNSSESFAEFYMKLSNDRAGTLAKFPLKTKLYGEIRGQK